MSTPDKAAPQLQKETALDALQMRQRLLEEELEKAKAAIARLRKADDPQFSQAVRTAPTPVSYSSRRSDRKSTTSVIPKKMKSEYPSSIIVKGFPGKTLVKVPIGPETITLKGFKEYIHQELNIPENEIIKPVHQGMEIHTDKLLQSLLKGSQMENLGWIQYFIRPSPETPEGKYKNMTKGVY